MKKIFKIFPALALVFGVTSCGNNKAPSNNPSSSVSPTSQVAPTSGATKPSAPTSGQDEENYIVSALLEHLNELVNADEAIGISFKGSVNAELKVSEALANSSEDDSLEGVKSVTVESTQLEGAINIDMAYVDAFLEDSQTEVENNSEAKVVASGTVKTVYVPSALKEATVEEMHAVATIDKTGASYDATYGLKNNQGTTEVPPMVSQVIASIIGELRGCFEEGASNEEVLANIAELITGYGSILSEIIMGEVKDHAGEKVDVDTIVALVEALASELISAILEGDVERVCYVISLIVFLAQGEDVTDEKLKADIEALTKKLEEPVEGLLGDLSKVNLTDIANISLSGATIVITITSASVGEVLEDLATILESSSSLNELIAVILEEVRPEYTKEDVEDMSEYLAEQIVGYLGLAAESVSEAGVGVKLSVALNASLTGLKSLGISIKAPIPVEVKDEETGEVTIDRESMATISINLTSISVEAKKVEMPVLKTAE